MFEKLITEVLNKVLGEFIDNLDANQLDISLLNGKVKLQNMKIKSTIFDSLPLPFSLVYGQIGLIDLTIPVWNVFNSPLIIEIKDVFALVKPKHIKEWNEEVEKKAFREQTQNKLEQFELFSQNAESLKKKDPSSVDKLLAKILDNIQITVSNVYIRYEDEFSASNIGDGKFTCGILLQEFSAYTTGSNWVASGLQVGQDITYKLAKVKNFTVFLDYNRQQTEEIKQQHDEIDTEKLFADKEGKLFKDILEKEFAILRQEEIKEQIQNTHESSLLIKSKSKSNHNYLLDKFSLEVRIVINKTSQANKLPQIDLNLLLGGQYNQVDDQNKEVASINFGVRQPQIFRVLKLVEYIGYFNEFQKGALIKYLLNKISKEKADQYIKTYIEWKSFTRSKSDSKNAQIKKKELENLEQEYTYARIVVLRKYAVKLIQLNEEKQKNLKEYEKKMSEIKSKKKSGWFTSKEQKVQNEKEIEEFQNKLQESLKIKEQEDTNQWQLEIDQLNSDLNQENTIEETDFNKMPEDYIRFKFKIEAPAFVLEFMNEYEQSLFKAEISQQLVYMELGNEFIKLQFQVCSIKLEDYWSGASVFPNLIETREIIGEAPILSQEPQFHPIKSKQALFIKFESGKNVKNAPFKLYLETQKTLFIIANLIFVKEIQRTLVSAFQGETLDFSFFKDAATERAFKYMKAGKEIIEALKKGHFKHQAFDIKVFLKAPVFIVPENVFDSSRPCVILDTGLIKVSSHLQNYEKIIDYKMLTSSENLYDKYEASLQNLSLNILGQGLTQGTSSYKKGLGQSVLKDFNASFILYNCLEPFHPIYPTAEMNIQIENIEILSSITMIRSTMGIVYNILDTLDSKEYTLVKKLKKEVVEDIKDIQTEMIENIRKRAEEEKLDFEKHKGQQEHGQDDDVFLDALEQDIKIHDEVRKGGVDSLEVVPEEYEMLLANPQVESQPNTQKDKKIDQFNLMDQFSPTRGSLMQKSLTVKNEKKQRTQQENEDEEFKDAYNEEEYEEAESHDFQQFINELDFKLVLTNGNIDIECNLQDLRLNFAMPTIEEVVRAQIDIVELFEDLDKARQTQKQRTIQKYENVITNIHNTFQEEEYNLLKKIFLNQSQGLGQQLNEFRQNIKKEIEKLATIQDFGEEESDLKVYEDILQKSQSIVTEVKEELKQKIEKNIKEGLKTQLETVKEKLHFTARLNDFSVWIPLDASDIHTQIFSLSFVSDISFNRKATSEKLSEVEHNETLRKTLQEQKDEIQISLNQLVIQNLNPKAQKNDQNKQGYNMLSPCRITVKLDLSQKNKEEHISKNNITVNIEPIHLRVGFQQVDFVNLLLIEVQKQILQQYENQSKKSEQLKLQESKQAQEIKKKREENQRRKRQLIQQNKELYDKLIEDKKSKNRINYTNVKVVCEILTLSLVDDSEEISQPLVHLSVEQTQFYLKQFQQGSDSQESQSMLMISQSLIQEEIRENRFYMNMQACSKFLINYYNLRSFSYEPLLEPWSILFKLKQDTPNSQKEISVESEHMLNFNLTHGMALTSRKIVDRLEKSLKQAKRQEKIIGKQQLTFKEEEEELEFMKQQEQLKEQLAKQEFSLQSMTKKLNQNVAQQTGFIFKNFSNLAIKVQVHNDTILEEEEKSEQHIIASTKQNTLVLPIRGFNISKDQQHFFKSFDELYEIQKDIKMKESKQNTIEDQSQEEPIKIDIKINHTHYIEGIPIEGVGIYSYIAQGLGTQSKTKVKVQEVPQQKEKKEGLFGFGLMGNNKDKEREQEREKVRSPKKLNEHKVGVICNIKMDGIHKKVQFESQLLLVNNLGVDLKIFAALSTQKIQNIPESQKIYLSKSGQIYRAPLDWFLSYEPYSLYVEGKSMNYLLLKEIDSLFGLNQKESKVSQQHSSIIKISDNYYATVDIQGYKCLPKSTIDGPLQYLVSFNPPLAMTNYNFSALEVVDTKTKEILSLMGPKETAYLNYADTLNGKYNLSWTFFDQSSDPLQLITENFMVIKKVDTQTQEKFIVQSKLKGSKGYREESAIIQIEVKKQYYQNIPEYDGENFELRERISDFTSSLMLMIYPKYIIVNRTSVNFICEHQTFEPFTNKYLNMKEGYNKVRFRVPGYEISNVFDISTIGLSGALELELDNPKEIIQGQIQAQYIAQKVEFGVQIQSAPTPYNKTTLISLVPRYVLVNQLQRPIVIKQKGYRQQILVSGDQVSYNFEQKINKLILVREVIPDEEMSIKKGKGLFADMATDEQFWSAPFSIEDIEDFQIAFAGQNQHKNQLQEKKSDGSLDSDWYQPTIRNGHQRFVRVIITTQDDATILVVFTNPIYPEYEIQNKTNEPVQFSQVALNENFLSKKVHNLTKNTYQDSLIGKFQILQKHSSIAYTWQDKVQPVKKLLVKIDDTESIINLDKAEKRKVVQTLQNKKYLLQVIATGNQKVLEISDLPIDFNIQEEEKYVDEQKKPQKNKNIIKKRGGDQFSISVKLKGIGISVIDEVPKELLFLSLYNINVQLSTWTEIRNDGLGVPENVTKLYLRIQHLQLDNMTNIELPVILCPSKPLNRKLQLGDVEIDDSKKRLDENEEEKQSENNKFQEIDETPFIQFTISIVEGYGGKIQDVNSIKVTRLRELQFAIQEFIFKLDTSVINTNVKFIEEIVHIFIDQQQHQLVASSESFARASMSTREKHCVLLDAKRPILPDASVVQANKMYMEFIHLGAIKAIITIKFEKKAVEFDISDPKKGFGAFGLIYTLLASAASISNSTLSFKELILVNTFISQDMLAKQLGKNYARQGVLQFYKLLGSSDMIGNPLGLVDKLGTGVFEFFSEPTKGLLKGPDEFIGGIGMGVKGLVTNVVSGGMDSVSKISGSLYSVVKNATGQNVELKKPDHVFDGIYQGVKGGAQEIFGGITGLITRPIEQTREKGAIGVFQGIGQGLFGAISAPVTATLRLGNAVAQGVSQTATQIGNIGKDQIASNASRFRPPRYINIKNVLKPYDEETSLVYQVIADLNKGKYANATIKYFCSLPETRESGELVNKNMELNTIAVITDQYFLYIRLEQEGQYRGQGTLLFKCKLKKIHKCEVYKGVQQPIVATDDKKKASLASSSKLPITQVSHQISAGFEYYKLQLVFKGVVGENRYQFFSLEYHKFEKIYDILSIIPQVEAKDEVSGRREKASGILCC